MAASGLLTVLAVVLLLWGIITLVRRIAEEEQTSARPPRHPEAQEGRRSDDIDWEELQRAEEEVKDLGADARPEDGFEGDDWGPGAPRKPPLV